MGVRPNNVSDTNQKGLQLFQSGRLKEAQKQYQKSLKLDPNNGEAYHLLGLIAHVNKDYYQAEKSIRRAIKFDPKYWAAHNNLSVVLQESGQFEEALSVLQNLVKNKPDYADAWRNLGVVLGQLGHIEDAEESLSKAKVLAPHSIDTQFALAQIFRQSNQLVKAVEAYQEILAAHPKHAETLFQYAQCLAEVGNRELAQETVSKLLALAPKRVDALLLSGSLKQSSGQLEDAVALLKQALKVEPKSLEAKQSLAGNLLNQRRYQEAETLYREILQSKGKHPSTYSSLLMLSNYQSKASSLNCLEDHRRYEKLLDAKSFKDKPKALDRAELNNRKIKIGFVSGDFYYHSVAYFFSPLIKNLDKNRFEVFCYYNNVREDVYTQAIRDDSDQWLQCVNMSGPELHERIVKDKIDVLVDLSGHTAANRLEVFAQRAAPIQVSWLGYPNTSGLANMDFRMVDEFTDPLPESQPYVSEQLLHLPNFLCYEAPDDAPELEEPNCTQTGIVTFGSFNNLVKVTDQVLEVWAEILSKIEGSRLILKSSQLADSSVADKVTQVFEDKGVSKDRIQLLARLHDPSDHLKLYQQVDIGLDPFPYNGTTTTFEAMWMGVPTLTICGDRHASRVGYSILSHLGLDEWAAMDERDCIEKACSWAKNLSSLAELKKTLRQKLSDSVLCDAPGFARNFESAIDVMVTSKLS